MITIRKEISINEGTAPYTYQWINLSSSCIVSFDNESGASSGLIETDVTFPTENCISTSNIALQLTDSNGCTGSFPISFRESCDTVEISSLSSQLKGGFLLLTAITTPGNYTYEWNWDDNYFENISINNTGDSVSLKFKEISPINLSTIISVTITDQITGCTDTRSYVHMYCNIVANNIIVPLCITSTSTDGGNSTVTINDIEGCNGADINWNELELNLPTGFTWEFFNGNVGNTILITGPGDPVKENYSVSGTWSVKDEQGNSSTVGNITINVIECNPVSSSRIRSSDRVITLTCEEVNAFPGNIVLESFINNITVDDNINIDWKTFRFYPGSGQTVSEGQGLNSILTTPFATYTINDDFALEGDYTSIPSGATSIRWAVSGTDGTQTGTVNFLVDHNCIDNPVTASNAFTISATAPYPYHDVLDNDSGLIDPTSINISTLPIEGTILIDSTGMIQYSPAETTEGNVSFGYTVRDYDNQLSNESIVTMTIVRAGNNATITGCGTFVPTLFNSLSNATVGGTWTRISATGPTAPPLYNDPITFTGQLDETYEYEYTVSSGLITDTARVIVNYETSCCNFNPTIQLTGETESVAIDQLSSTVRYSWNAGAGNLFTGTITIVNIDTSESQVINVLTPVSSGEALLTFTFPNTTWVQHNNTIEVNFTNTDNCNCTTSITNFAVPRAEDLVATISIPTTCS